MKQHTQFLFSERFSNRRNGFSLLETAIALAVLGLLAGGILQLVTVFAENQSYNTTSQRMEVVHEALILYAAREGFLPCPADATASANEAGVAQAEDSDNVNCTEGRSMVAVPWRTLGIPRSTTFDGWGYRFTYVVFDGNTGVTRGETSNDEGLDMLTCSCPGPNCDDPDDSGTLTDCLPDDPNDSASTEDHVNEFLRDKGLEMRTVAGEPDSAFMDPAEATGAAFVLISHGPNAAGAYGPASRIDDPDEAKANEHANVTFDGIYVDAQVSQITGTEYDDIVRAARIDAVAEQAGWFLRE